MEINIPGLFYLIPAAGVLALYAGALRIPLSEVFAILTGAPALPTHEAVVLKIRLPRVFLAALVGACLGVSGATFQGVLRNPLADPYLLGVSGGAALGAVLAITLGLRSPLALPAAAFIGALVALAAVYVAAKAHQSSTHTMVLAGVMVGSFATALLLFLLWTAPADASRTAVFWLTGDLASADTSWLPWAGLWCAAAFWLLWRRAAPLDLFTQGEATAADLGLDVGRARLVLFAGAGALTACAVALAGLVGFVGLVVPHVVRMVWGPAHRRLLPASALLGAAFLVAADALARSVLSPAEVPVGVVTALAGAPFFLYLLRRRDTGS